MSILFQLFNAEDLRDETKFRIIRDTIRASNFDPALDITVNTTLDPSTLVPTQVKNQVVEAILQQASKAFTQLLGQPISQPRTSNQLDLSQSLYPQILSQVDHDRLNTYQQDIFERAISCEVTHFNFYVRLLTLQDTVSKAYQASTGQQLQGHPDTNYSPFNPNGPLYHFYNP